MRFATIAESLHANSVLVGDKVAVWCEVTGTTLTHRELYARCSGLAKGLGRLGVGFGDRIAVLGGNSRRHIEVLGAAAVAGVTVVPVNPALEKVEVGEILKEVGPKVVLVLRGDGGQVDPDSWKVVPADQYDDFVDEVATPAPPPELNIPPEHPWNILYTSGTSSGRPKGAIRSHAAAIAGFLTHTGPLNLTSSTVGLVLFPLHGVSSVFFSFLYLYIQAAMVIVDYRDPAHKSAIVKTIVDRKVTYMTASPGVMYDIFRLEARYDGGRLQTMLLTGALSDPGLKDRVKEYFGKSVRVYDVYGSTEAGLITMQTPEDMEIEEDNVGKETPGTPLVRIEGNGTGGLMVKTPMMFTRYLHDPPETDYTNKYFRQGDLGYRTPHGNIRIMGRQDDLLVLPTGHNIYPIEIETAILRHIPALLECYVFGTPTNHHPESIIAVCTSSTTPLPTPTHVEGAMGTVAPGRKPNKYFVLPSSHPLPRTANGKIIKRMLRETVAGLEGGL